MRRTYFGLSSGTRRTVSPSFFCNTGRAPDAGVVSGQAFTQKGFSMKFGRFQLQSRTFFGLVEGDQVAELDGSPFDSYKANGKRHALSALKTLIPCEPRNFYCAGLNYAAHIEWGAKRKGIAYRSPKTPSPHASRAAAHGKNACRRSSTR
jgi:2-keto-4-pentenoate hydratase/2-oxohepta-3-ene-1,7-dioic acid hydratase in catechol pathway